MYNEVRQRASVTGSRRIARGGRCVGMRQILT